MHVTESFLCGRIGWDYDENRRYKMEKWVVAAKRADFNSIGQEFEIDPVIARLIRNRDVTGRDNIRMYLKGSIEDIPSPWLMKDMKKAVKIIKSANKN